MNKHCGFTLPEILIAVGIVSILATILVPLLISPRARAYDVATEACLKEVSSRQLAHASQDPFQYDPAFKPYSVSACTDVGFTNNTTVTTDAFTYEAKHNLGVNTYTVSAGTGVTKVGATSVGNNGGGNGKSGNNGNGNGNSGNGGNGNGNGNSGNNGNGNGGNGGGKKP